MIKTKSILAKKSNDDGIRICVMRWVKPFYDYDEWIKELAPSERLLTEYRSGQIDWQIFASSYKVEMNWKRNIIKSLRKRSDDGQVITLLCWEIEDTFCHRGILKELIEEDILVKYRISYYGNNDTIYSVLEEYGEDEEISTGVWETPFNSDSPAIGFYERLIQSDYCPPIYLSDEHITKIKISRV